jgi:hypothetical protein
MGRIIQPKLNIVESVRSNDEMMYALKHHQDGLQFQGIWQCDQFRDGELISGGYPESPNIFMTVGIGRMLTVYFHDVAKGAAGIFYVGIFKANITPAAGDTSAKLGTGNAYLECQDADYDDPLTDKPSYVTADTATATITNSASKAHFVMDASITVYGAFLNTVAAKTSATGYLTCAKKFAASRSVIADDELDITYQISVTSS